MASELDFLIQGYCLNRTEGQKTPKETRKENKKGGISKVMESRGNKQIV